MGFCITPFTSGVPRFRDPRILKDGGCDVDGVMELVANAVLVLDSLRPATVYPCSSSRLSPASGPVFLALSNFGQEQSG